MAAVLAAQPARPPGSPAPGSPAPGSHAPEARTGRQRAGSPRSGAGLRDTAIMELLYATESGSASCAGSISVTWTMSGGPSGSWQGRQRAHGAVDCPPSEPPRAWARTGGRSCWPRTVRPPCSWGARQAAGSADGAAGGAHEAGRRARGADTGRTVCATRRDPPAGRRCGPAQRAGNLGHASLAPPRSTPTSRRAADVRVPPGASPGRHAPPERPCQGTGPA